MATLVRATPPASARMTILYLHGRNDYFFQTEMADRLREAGAAFYALDMRKYGRSLRPHQTIGYADDLSVYDEEIDPSCLMCCSTLSILGSRNRFRLYRSPAACAAI